MTNPSLPQNDSATEQSQRKAELAQQQKTYVYDHNSRIKPLAVVNPLPKNENFSPILAGSLVLLVLELLGNVLAKGSKLLDDPSHAQTDATNVLDENARKEACALLVSIRDKHRELTGLLTTLHVDNQPSVAALAQGIYVLPGEIEQQTKAALERMVGDRDRLSAGAVDKFGDLIKDLIEMLLSAAGKVLLRYLDLYGQATSMYSYASQFQTMRLQEIASNSQDDIIFAWLRVAGPNPLVINRIEALDSRFPVTEEQYQSVMTKDDSLARAGKEGRLYLTDYKVLSTVTTGTFPDQQKYLEAPLALFAVPPEGAQDRRLCAVAIQLSQVPGHTNPVFTPSDGPNWEIAKAHFQVADANHHEMISHLGRTHLLIEAFALATPRQLASEHPLNILLTPHFKGTLAVNNAAEAALIAPKGLVDRLLAGTIEASTKLAVDSVLNFGFNSQMLPAALARRGVDNDRALPSYPYRDDGLLVWDAIHTWVSDYLAVYYNTDADVIADYELQNWLNELTSPAGGGLTDIGQDGAIRTFDYLVNAVTLIIFTASAQHAVVNFSQNFIMSYTPAQPFAAYAAAPTRTQGAVPDKEIFRHLPPLQQSFFQLALTHLLGSAYFTRLGDYSRNIPGKYFTDPRVSGPLSAFQSNLFEVEQTIGKRNLNRIPYVLLLPSSIPQSINI